MCGRTQFVRGFAAVLVTSALITLSTSALSARALNSIEQITVEIHASNSAPYGVTIVGSREAATGRSTGRRQYQPWRFDYSVPSGSPVVSRSWVFDVAEPQAQRGTPMEGELDSIIYLKIEWPKNGVVQKCMLTSSAIYRAADHKFIVRLGDLAKLADASGRPIGERCAEK